MALRSIQEPPGAFRARAALEKGRVLGREQQGDLHRDEGEEIIPALRLRMIAQLPAAGLAVTPCGASA